MVENNKEKDPKQAQSQSQAPAPAPQSQPQSQSQSRQPRRDSFFDKRNSDEFADIVVKVKRCSKTVKGGKRFSFSALVVVGNRSGKVGFGYGKAQEVQFAVQKGIKNAKKNIFEIPIVNTTIPHSITAKFGATSVVLKPACKGTGVIAGASVKAVVELAGIKNILSKVFGSTNAINAVKATMIGLQSLRKKGEIETIRGVNIA